VLHQTKGPQNCLQPQLGEGIFPIPIHKDFSDGPRMHIDPSTNIYTCVPGRQTVITITITITIIIIIIVIIISISISISIIVILFDVRGTCTASQDAQSSGHPPWVPTMEPYFLGRILTPKPRTGLRSPSCPRPWLKPNPLFGTLSSTAQQCG
jgi:hypothetical protein